MQESLFALQIRQYRGQYDVDLAMSQFNYNFISLYAGPVIVLFWGVMFRIFALIALYASKPDSYFQRFVSLFSNCCNCSAAKQKLTDKLKDLVSVQVAESAHRLDDYHQELLTGTEEIQINYTAAVDDKQPLNDANNNNLVEQDK